jgi:hypothetical protein
MLGSPGRLGLAALVLLAAPPSGAAATLTPVFLSASAAADTDPADKLPEDDATRVKRALEGEKASLEIEKAAPDKIKQALVAKAEALYRKVKSIAEGKSISDSQKSAAQALALEAMNAGTVPPPSVEPPSPVIPTPSVPPRPPGDATTPQTPAPSEIEDLKRPDGIDLKVVENAIRTSQNLPEQLKKQGKSNPEIEKQVGERIERLLTDAFRAKNPTKPLDEVKAFSATLTKKIMEGVELSEKPPAVVIRYEPFVDQLIEATRQRNEALKANGSNPQTEIHMSALQDFAEKKARELAGIKDDLTKDEQDGIRTNVVGRVLASSLTEPTARTDGAGGPVPEATRTRINGLLTEIVNRIFPMVAGLDANSKKSNLIKFLKDNQGSLRIPESIAESLVEDFLRNNPGVSQPTTTTTTTTLVPTTAVQPTSFGGGYMLVPCATGWCPLFRR